MPENSAAVWPGLGFDGVSHRWPVRCVANRPKALVAIDCLHEIERNRAVSGHPPNSRQRTVLRRYRASITRWRILSEAHRKLSARCMHAVCGARQQIWQAAGMLLLLIFQTKERRHVGNRGGRNLGGQSRAMKSNCARRSKVLSGRRARSRARFSTICIVTCRSRAVLCLSSVGKARKRWRRMRNPRIMEAYRKAVGGLGRTLGNSRRVEDRLIWLIRLDRAARAIIAAR